MTAAPSAAAGAVRRGRAAPDTVPGHDLAGETQRLADLHSRGLLDDEEFKAAKQAAIARSVS